MREPRSDSKGSGSSSFSTRSSYGARAVTLQPPPESSSLAPGGTLSTPVWLPPSIGAPASDFRRRSSFAPSAPNGPQAQKPTHKSASVTFRTRSTTVGSLLHALVARALQHLP